MLLWYDLILIKILPFYVHTVMIRSKFVAMLCQRIQIARASLRLDIQWKSDVVDSGDFPCRDPTVFYSECVFVRVHLHDVVPVWKISEVDNILFLISHRVRHFLLHLGGFPYFGYFWIFFNVYLILIFISIAPKF
jgi:hypothetical protein